MPAIRIQPRPHQVTAIDAAAAALRILPGQGLPPEGLRTQVTSATGSGKTLMTVRTADQLGAARVAVLVPNLDLLVQTAEEWRAAGHDRPMVGLCSLTSTKALPCTTDPDELVALTAHLPEVTVFATYASVGLGTLQRAHEAGLPPWSLIVLDEAHRLSGRAGKPWAAALDNSRIPADRRLFMTATPRLWELGGTHDENAEPDGAGGQGGSGRGVRLIASMDDEQLFGKPVFELMLGDAVDQGIVAPYRIVCVEVSDPAWQAALAQGEDPRSERVRGLRLAALRAAVLKTSADYRLSQVLTLPRAGRRSQGLRRGPARRRPAAGG
jgi:predicted helicase